MKSYIKNKVLNIETIINNEKITDHHAIILTQNIDCETKLQKIEKIIYNRDELLKQINEFIEEFIKEHK